MREFSTRVLRPSDLFALRYVHDARVSPDGRHLAYVTSRTDDRAAEEIFEITLMDLRTGRAQALAFPGCASSPRWSPKGDWLAFVGRRGSQRLYRTTPDLSDPIALTPEGTDVVGAPDWAPDGGALVYSIITRKRPEALRRITHRQFRSEGLGITEGLSFEIQVVEVGGGRIRDIDVGSLVATQPLFGPDGRRILFLGVEGAVGHPSLSFDRVKLFTVDLLDGRIVDVLGDGWFVAGFAWVPSGQRIVFAGDYKSVLPLPMPRLWTVAADGLSEPQCRTKTADVNVGSRMHHDMPTWETSQESCFRICSETAAYATVLRQGRTEIWRVALNGPEMCEAVVSGDRSCIILDADRRQLFYVSSDLHRPWELYQLDLQSHKETRFTRLNDEVMASWPVMAVEHLQFRSPDGVCLEGWHLRRAERQGPQPTVLFIHGGPMLSTGHVFRFDLHLLAANGYAVLFSNFRGSSGYGEAFNRAIVGDWGMRAFPDHMSTADTAVSIGLSDSNRLGVWGASHGGFATAWIVGHSDRFRAAVVESAAINLSTMYYLSDAADLFAKDLGGRPDEIPDVYRSRSPLTYAGRCRTPTLVVHGENDERCPIAEAEQFYRALHDARCTTELVRIPGMRHIGDSTGPLSARWAQNEALLEWFERYL